MRASLLLAGFATCVLAAAIAPTPVPAWSMTFGSSKNMQISHEGYAQAFVIAPDLTVMTIKRGSALTPQEVALIHSRLIETYGFCEGRYYDHQNGAVSIYDCFIKKVAEFDIHRTFGQNIRVAFVTTTTGRD